MPIDAALALAAPPRTTELVWQARDVLLYHLGVGAGAHRPATDPGELRYTYEKDLRVLPGFVTVAGGGLAGAGVFSQPGLDLDLTQVLHGGQRIELFRPVPTAGRAVLTSRLVAVQDKGAGRAAVLVVHSEAVDGRGPLWSCDTEVFVRGAGGFGGERGGSTRIAAPERGPEWESDVPVRHDQALLYRLSGDWNPLHADPGFAALAGFDRPILHGLCSYGTVLKSVVDTVLGGDPGRVRSYGARFAGVFFPGETLHVRIWDEGTVGPADSGGPGRAPAAEAPVEGTAGGGMPGGGTAEGRAGGGRLVVTATALERADAPVLSDAVLTYW